MKDITGSDFNSNATGSLVTMSQVRFVLPLLMSHLSGTPPWGCTPPHAAQCQEDRHSQNDISVDRAHLVPHRYQSREHTRPHCSTSFPYKDIL